MRITIVGGGNIGTQFAVHCAEKGHEVIVYTSTPDVFENRLTIVDDLGQITHEGAIKTATYDPKTAFNNAELILVTVPAMAMKNIAELIYKNTTQTAIIGVVPGNGGGECVFQKCIGRGNIFFGIERVPAIARLIQKGKCVKSANYRNELHVASLPKQYAGLCARLTSDLFDIPTKVIPNFLNLTMTPSNPILHTTRLYTLFYDWHEGVTYRSIPLFYEEWNDESSELLLKCDEEVQNICRAMPEFELQYVKSLKEHYESPDAKSMTRKISSIQSFKGLQTPVIAVENGLIPNLHSRYFTADFSYGLTIIKQIADFAGIKVSNIDNILSWYSKIAVEKHEFHYKDYGINNYLKFREYYLQ